MILHSADSIRHYRAEGQWGSLTLDELFRRNAAATPDRLAVADAPNRPEFTFGEPRRLTYAELGQEVERTAAGLLAAGVCKDSIIVVQLPNIVEQLLTYLACARLGAIVSPLPLQYRAHEIGQILDTLGEVAAVITVARFKEERLADTWAELLAARAVPPRLLVYGDDTGAFHSPLPAGCSLAQALETLAQYGAALRIDADEIYTICWTSGTTAAPKGVPRSHNNWILYARIVAETCDARDGECMLSPFPAVNLSGIGLSLLVWLFKAGTLHLHHPLDIRVLLRQLAEEKISLAAAAPAVLTLLLQDPALAASHDLSALRCVLSGSAALSGWMIGEYARRFGIEIVNGFGSNEGVTLASSVREIPNPERRAECFPRIGAAGVPPALPYHRWIETKLVDPVSGQEISEAGVSGELRVRGGAIFPGYYGRPDLTAAAFDEQGYFRTGDLFEIARDDAGRPWLYRLVGRLASQINRGGMKISPEEIAALLERHPAVLEADASGYPDPVMGERVCACVVLRPQASLTLAELAAFLSSQGIAKYKLPERLQCFERLPRNPVGKVERQALRQQVLAAVRAEALRSADGQDRISV